MKTLCCIIAFLIVCPLFTAAQNALPVDTAALTNTANKATKLLTDTTAVNKVKTSVTDKATEIKDHYKTELNNTTGKFNILSKINNSKITFTGSVSADGEYVSRTNLPQSANGFYSRVGVNGGVKIGNLPFNAGVTVNFRNNKLWADYTLMNFTFDSKGFLSGLKNNYLDYLSDIGNFYSKEMADMLKGYQDSLTRLGDLKNTLSSSSYYDKVRELTGNYKTLQDSVTKGSMDSCVYEDYSRISDSIAYYKNIVNEFSSLEKYKDTNRQMQQYLDKYNSYVDSVKNMKDILSVDGMKDQLLKSGLLSKQDLNFSGIKKLGIGRVNLDLSDFTARGQSIYGFNVDYLIKNLLYTGVGLGMASPNNYQFNPTLNSLNKPIKMNFTRWLGYLRLGVGKPEEDHVHLIWQMYGDKFTHTTSNNTFVSAPANSVLALVFNKGVKDAVTFSGEFATSNSSDSLRAATFLPFEVVNKKPKLNFALQTAIKGQIKKTQTTLGVKAKAISQHFRSAGNLFMRRDYAEYSVSLAQPLFAGKVNLSSMFTHNFSGVFSGQNPTSFINVNSTLNISPVQFVTYILTYNYIKQLQQNATGYTLNSHQLTAIQQYQYGNDKTHGTTSLTFSYIQTGTGTPETPVNNRTLQGGLNQQVTLPKNITLSAGGGISAVQLNGNFQRLAYWAESSGKFSIKSKCNIMYSMRYVKDPGGLSNIFANATLSAQLYKGLQLRAGEQLQTILNDRTTFNTQTTLGLSYTFSYTLKKTLNLKLKKKDSQPLINF